MVTKTHKRKLQKKKKMIYPILNYFKTLYYINTISIMRIQFFFIFKT